MKYQDEKEEKPYYMKNEYEFINTKEFGLRDMYKAWCAGAIAHYERPRQLSNYDYFIKLSIDRGWIDNEKI